MPALVLHKTVDAMATAADAAPTQAGCEALDAADAIRRVPPLPTQPLFVWRSITYTSLLLI